MATAKRLGLQFCGTAILFSAFVSLTTSGVLLLACVLGYLPYSDRPGPGWWGRVHWPSPAEIGTYLGFAPWFAYFCWSALSGEGQQIEVAVIALQPIDREYSVELPSGGHVVYVLHDERLEPHPAFTKTNEQLS